MGSPRVTPYFAAWRPRRHDQLLHFRKRGGNALCAMGTFRHAAGRPKGDTFTGEPAPQGRALNLPLRAGLAADDRVVVSVLLVEDDAAADAVARSLVVSRRLEPRLTRVASMAQALPPQAGPSVVPQ